MTGIIIEVVAAFAISVISGLEVADLTLEARQAEIVAGQANEQAANTYSNSLVLQKQVLDSSNRLAETESFAARIRMSLITSSWMYFDDKKFVADLKDKPKGGVVIFVRPNDEDALLLAVKFEQALKQAGWSASDPKPIDADELLKNPTFENGISSVSKEQFDMRAIMLEKPNVKPGVPFSWMDLEKTDTPARALWASMQDSGIMCGLMMTDPALPDNMLKIVIGRKML